MDGGGESELIRSRSLYEGEDMTQQRAEELLRMLEAWQETDANDFEAEKTAAVGELFAEVAYLNEAGTATTR
jgi:hypothetical protein